MYDGKGKNLDGPLPQDRTHYFKAYGTYAFPFGLTVGVVGYGRSGLPVTTKLHMNNRWMLVENRGDMGRLPFTFWADLYSGLHLQARRQVPGLHQPPDQQRDQHQDDPEQDLRLQPGRDLGGQCPDPRRDSGPRTTRRWSWTRATRIPLTASGRPGSLPGLRVWASSSRSERNAQDLISTEPVLPREGRALFLSLDTD